MKMKISPARTTAERAVPPTRECEEARKAADKRHMAAAKGAPETIVWNTCDPTERNGKVKLNRVLFQLEEQFRDEARLQPEGKLHAIIIEVDKARQTPLNALAGKDEGGEAAMHAYLDLVQSAVRKMSHNGDGRYTIALNRVSSYSDEAIVVIAGRDPEGLTKDRFEQCLKEARGEMDLSQYRFKSRVKTGNGCREVELDLESFSHALRHPELAVACHLNVSGVIEIDGSAPRAYLRRALMKMENDKITFYGELPECMRRFGDGKAEVLTNFGLSDVDFEERRESVSGTVFQMRVRPENPEDARRLVDFVKITRKGWELWNGLLGQSHGNTLIGNARNNELIGRISQVFWQFGIEEGLQFQPVFGHMTFRVEGCGSPAAIAAGLEQMALHVLPEGLEAKVRYTRVENETIEKVRQRLTLLWMGKSEHDTFLNDADYLLNFLENVEPTIVQHILLRLSQAAGEDGRKLLGGGDLDALRIISDYESGLSPEHCRPSVCGLRRTVREWTDLDALLRHDEELGHELGFGNGDSRAMRAELLGQVLDIAKRSVAAMREMLVECVLALNGKRE